MFTFCDTYNSKAISNSIVHSAQYTSKVRSDDKSAICVYRLWLLIKGRGGGL